MFGPPPTKPGTLYGPPQAGVRSPQFHTAHVPTVDAPYRQFRRDKLSLPDPVGNYQSQVDTRPPLDAGRRKAVTAVASRYFSPEKIAAEGLGIGGASRSVGALGRALSDLSKNALDRGVEQFDSQYRTEAEQARAEDIQSQRQNVMDRWEMDVRKATFEADTWARWTTKIEDGMSHYRRELANSKSIVTQAVTRGLMGMLGGFL